MTTGLDDRLVQAMVDVADGLELSTTLDRILSAAIELTGARYGALGVLGDTPPESGRALDQFRHQGMEPQVVADIGQLPRGRGVLGELISHPTPLRLPHLAAHPSATGFPPGHPPMDSFLGVPIRAGESVFGNLYLTDKPGGFDEEDERRVVALATAAGVAIRNSQLFEVAQVGGQWQAAAAEMANMALRDEDGGDVLAQLVRSAREVAHADIAMVISPHEGEVQVEVFDTSDPDLGLPDADVLCATTLGHLRAVDPTAVQRCLDGTGGASFRDIPLSVEPGTAQRLDCFPVRTDSGSIGTLVLMWTDPDTMVTDDRVAAVEGLAVQAAVSLTLDVARLAEQKLLVFRDRDRIARDLHDLVVQRMFAAGVSLQVLARRDDLPAEAHERIAQLITETDATIAQIRDTIFELREGFSGTWQLTEALQAESDRMTEALGFAPVLHVDGELTTVDADDIIPDAVAVVRESLSNIARHADASAAEVRVWFRDGLFGIEVSDDGAGPGDTERSSGLANMATRAESRGGASRLAPGASGGSVLEWSVPLHILPG